MTSLCTLVQFNQLFKMWRAFPFEIDNTTAAAKLTYDDDQGRKNDITGHTFFLFILAIL